MGSEKENMLAGKRYGAFDAELVAERANCRKTVELFNGCSSDDFAGRAKALRKLLGICPKDAFIEPPFRCDYGYNISVGKRFYANFDCVFLDVNPIEIGDHVMMGPGVHIYTVNHPLDPVERKTFDEYGQPVTIANNVWIGGKAIICPGVKIGENSVIGAGSVVTKDIPANVMAAGNPCRVIKAIV